MFLPFYIKTANTTYDQQLKNKNMEKYDLKNPNVDNGVRCWTCD